MASFRKRDPSRWQHQVHVQGYPSQIKTFITRAEAESTTLSDLLERYVAEVSPAKKKGPTPRLPGSMRCLVMHWLGGFFPLFVV